MEVWIKGQKYQFGFDSIWGPLYMYEEVCGDNLPYNPHKTLCMHIMWWCILVRSNPGCTLQLDDFLQALNDMALVVQLRDYYVQRMNVLGTGGEDAVDDKKKD